VRSHSATILPSANHECERIAHGYERRPFGIAWCPGTTMWSLVAPFNRPKKRLVKRLADLGYAVEIKPLGAMA